jgi:hypothetical protein
MTRLSTEAEERLGLRSSGESKYRARKCTIHTPPHASQKECRRYCELALLEKAGEIRHLRQQVRYILDSAASKKERDMVYVADFCFEELLGGTWSPVVVDVKGFRTKGYLLKKRWMRQRYGISIREE